MEEIYNRLWERALPYYQEGREMDLEHVSWMIKQAEKIAARDDIDGSLLLPIVILHDIGYSAIDNSDPYLTDTRRLHMQEGEALAEKILTELSYPVDKTDKIVYWISVHDNWALGDDTVYEDITLHVLTDLDFIWMTIPQGFEALKKIKSFNDREMLEFLEENDTLMRRPMCISETRQLLKKNLNALRARVNSSHED